MPRVQMSRSDETTIAAALVQASAPEEREYQRCLATIATRRRRVTELEAELGVLKGALARFETLCQARLGDLLTELRRVGAAAADYERRLEQLRANRATAEAPLVEEEPVPFARWDGEATVGSSGPAPRPRRTARRLPAAEAAEAKRLYLDLAKRCHPDYATTEQERRRREALMQRVNEAFRARDLVTLRALHRQAEADDPAFAARPVRERLAWAREELARLTRLLAELKAEFAALRDTEVHRLWRRYEAGVPVMERLEDDLERRLAAEGRRLDGLIAAYRRHLDERQSATAATA